MNTCIAWPEAELPAENLRNLLERARASSWQELGTVPKSLVVLHRQFMGTYVREGQALVETFWKEKLVR